MDPRQFATLLRDVLKLDNGQMVEVANRVAALLGVRARRSPQRAPRAARFS